MWACIDGWHLDFNVNFFCFIKSESLAKEEADDEDEDDDEDEVDDSEVKEENGVLVLNDANFDTFVEGQDTVLLEFYAPW